MEGGGTRRRRKLPDSGLALAPRREIGVCIISHLPLVCAPQLQALLLNLSSYHDSHLEVVGAPLLDSRDGIAAAHTHGGAHEAR